MSDRELPETPSTVAQIGVAAGVSRISVNALTVKWAVSVRPWQPLYEDEEAEPTAHTSSVGKAVRPPIVLAVPGFGVMAVETAAGAAGAATASASSPVASSRAAGRAGRGAQDIWAGLRGGRLRRGPRPHQRVRPAVNRRGARTVSGPGAMPP